MISFCTSIRGWRVPSFIGYEVRVRSSRLFCVCAEHVFSFNSLILSIASCFSSLIFIPTVFLSSAGTSLKSFISSEISPFLLRYFMRSCSISSALLVDKPLTSSRSFSIFSVIISFIFSMQR